MKKMESTLFRFFSDEDREAFFGYGESQTLRPNTPFLKEGEENHTLYLLLKGKVKVTRKVGTETLILATLEAPTALGELTFLEPGSSSATCETLEACTFQVFPGDVLEKIMEEKPRLAAQFLRGLALSLKERLLRTNEQVASYFDVSKALMDSHRFREFYGQLFR